MKRLSQLLLILLPLSLAAGMASARDGAVMVEKPWARASIGTTGPSAAFMTIVNKSGTADRLLSVSSGVAGQVEIHQTTVTDGRARMMKLDGLTIPAGGKVVLKPGSYHIMLMKLKQPLKKGGSLMLTLKFRNAGEMTVKATIMSVGSSGHKHHH